MWKPSNCRSKVNFMVVYSGPIFKKVHKFKKIGEIFRNPNLLCFRDFSKYFKSNILLIIFDKMYFEVFSNNVYVQYCNYILNTSSIWLHFCISSLHYMHMGLINMWNFRYQGHFVIVFLVVRFVNAVKRILRSF